MSVDSRSNLKSHFENGDVPNATDFGNLMDSFIHQNEDGVTVSFTNNQFRFGVGDSAPGRNISVRAMGEPGTGDLVGIALQNAAAPVNMGWELGQINNAGGIPTETDGRFAVNEKTISTGIKERISITPGGNVGIGTTQPTEALEVKGGIRLNGSPSNSPGFGTIAYSNSDIAAYIPDPASQTGGGRWVSLSATGSGGGGTVTSVNSQSPSGGDVSLNATNIPYTSGSTASGSVASAITSINATLANKADASALASKADVSALATKADVSPSLRAAGAIKFDKDSEYGTDVDPLEDSTLTLDPAEGKTGVTVLIIHKVASGVSTPPSLPSEFLELTGSAGYVVGKTNYIFCNFRSSSRILYSVSQVASE